MLAVALTGLLAWRLWGRRVGLVALALAAVYLPPVVVGGVPGSEPLFVVLVLGALLAALCARDERVAASGSRRSQASLAGLAAPDAQQRDRDRPSAGAARVALRAPRLSWRAAAPAVALSLAAVLTVAPWTIRNAMVLDSFVPVATQTGAALAGTYNDAAREDPDDPGAWRVLRLVPDYQSLYRDKARTPEAVLDRQLRDAALDYIADHPFYVLEVGFWNSLRMLDLTGRARSHETAEAIGIERGLGRRRRDRVLGRRAARDRRGVDAPGPAGAVAWSGRCRACCSRASSSSTSRRRASARRSSHSC